MRKILRKRATRFGCTLLAFVMLLGLLPTVALAVDGFSAAALTLQPGSNTSQINLNWYAETGTTHAQVRYKQTNAADYTTITATEKPAAMAAENGETVVCRATLTGLAPDTAYTYQVSNDGSTWSKEYTYTAPKSDSFTFAFVGDPQLKAGNQDAKSAGKTASGNNATETTIAQGWADTLSALSEYSVDFIASAGDQVDTTKTQSETNADNTGKETEYTMLFAPEQMRSLPFAASVGNHDRHKNFLDHYNLPNIQDVSGTVNSAATAAAVEATTAYGNYYYSYNNALFVVLNDSSYPGSVDEAKPFIDAFGQTLTAATTEYDDYDWLIVQHHKSTESVAQHVADRDIQYYVESGFEKLMDEFHVDFVLAGHDHVYARSYAMYDGKRVSDDADTLTNPAGTIYLTCNTGSGLKYYGIFSSSLYVKDNDAYPYLANGLTGSAEYLKGVYPRSTEVAVQNYIPGYTIVEVKGDTVTFTTYATYASADGVTKAGAVLDTFTVAKPEVNPFTDVSEKDWFFDDVQFAHAEGLMTGVSDTRFDPHGTTTRAMIVTTLWRMEGSPAPAGKNPFTDVPGGQWYTDAIRWASENGIVKGYGGGRFGAGDSVTREQLAAILYRHAAYKGYDVSAGTGLTFRDADSVSDWAFDAMCWITTNGVMVGRSSGILDPTGNAIRAEMAAMLHRFLGLAK